MPAEIKKRPTPEELRDNIDLFLEESLKDAKEGRIVKIKRIIE